LGADVYRFIQGGLAAPPGSAVVLLLFVIGWLIVLAMVAGVLQADRRRWLRGLVDIRWNLEQIASGMELLRRNKRPLWVLLVASVASWTCWSLLVWRERAGIADLETMLAMHGNSAMLLAWARSFSAAIVPLRDFVALGELLPLLVGATLLLFGRTPEMGQHLRSMTRAMENIRLKRRLGTLWVALIVLVAYRTVSNVVDPAAGITSGCPMIIDIVVLPVLLLMSDGLLLSWLLAEYGRAVRGHFDWQPDDTAAFVRGWPGAMLVCGLMNPGRYAVLLTALWETQFRQPLRWPASRWGPILWAAAIAQVIGLACFALPAVLAVCRRGGLRTKLAAWLMLFRRAGGQIVGLTALAVVLNVLVLWPFYWLFAFMQPETWSLIGAASYGHYVTLLLGIVVLGGTTQLAAREIGVEDEPAPSVMQSAAVQPFLAGLQTR
jgi:hypothetical protein